MEVTGKDATPNARWSKIPHWVILDKSRSVGPHAMHVLLAITTFADIRGKCWPSIDAIQKITGISRRGVQKAIQHLRAAKLVSVGHRQATASGRSESNIYCVKFIAQDMAEVRKAGRTHCAPPAHQERGEGAPGSPKLEPRELDPEELGVLDHVFVSLEEWERIYFEINATLPRGTVEEDRGFIGQIAWLIAGGAKIWPEVCDALAGAKVVSPKPDRPVAYIRRILGKTVGRETLNAYLRRAPTREESRRQLPKLGIVA